VDQPVGGAEVGVDPPQPLDRAFGGHHREEGVLAAGLDEEGPGGDQRPEVGMLHRPEHAREHLGPAHVPRHPVGLGPRREVAADHGGGHPCIHGGEEQADRPAVGETDDTHPGGVDQRVGPEDVEGAGAVPQVLGERVPPGHDLVDQIGVAGVVVLGFQSRRSPKHRRSGARTTWPRRASSAA